MKITPVRGLLLTGALCALVLNARAQIVELRATINQAQEVPASGSPATGTAIMHYNVATRTFDLMVTVNGFTNTATASHVHEAAPGVNGAVRSPNFGGDAAYTKTGTTLTGTFLNQAYSGNPVELLKGNSYYNLHSNVFAGGEVRGQLIPQPVRIYALLDLAQEQAAMPTVTFTGVNNFGAAVGVYDPATNRISLRTSIFNFTNSTFTNSHIHTGAPGVSGGVNTQLGNNANAGAYSSANGYIAGAHDNLEFGSPTAGPDATVLLSGGTYLNYHSQAFGNGQLRGQLYVSNEMPSARMVNIATRGFVGTGDQVLIAGFVVGGTEPVRVLVTAKGPSLTAFGVSGALANPVLSLRDSAGREIARNDDIGTIAVGSELAAIPGVPRTAAESALVVVLPPGAYTAIVSAATGTGIALVEAYDLRGMPAAAGPN